LARSAPGALDLALNAAHQRMQAERRFHRSDLRGGRRDDIVAHQRQLENRRRCTRHGLRRPSEWGNSSHLRMKGMISSIALAPPGGDPLLEHLQLGPRREVPQRTAHQNGAGFFLIDLVEHLCEALDQLEAKQVIRRMLHRDHRNAATLLQDNRPSTHHIPSIITQNHQTTSGTYCISYNMVIAAYSPYIALSA